MSRFPDKLFLLLTLAAVAAGCKPKIGDDCELSTDCSAAADRLCDITAPNGYCTIYNCEPGTCPEDESLCVEFGAQRSAVDACQSEQNPSPYARAFCMATCESSDDCRPEYECVNLRDPNNRHKWGAVLIDGDRGNRACLAKQTAVVPDPKTTDVIGVCDYEADGSTSQGGGTSQAGGSSQDGGDAGASQGGAGG